MLNPSKVVMYMKRSHRFCNIHTERIDIKKWRQRIHLLFHPICIEEEMLPKDTHTHVCVCVYACVCVCVYLGICRALLACLIFITENTHMQPRTGNKYIGEVRMLLCSKCWTLRFRAPVELLRHSCSKITGKVLKSTSPPAIV